MVRPKKHLGQHFLADPNIARKIVDTLSDTTDTVCELGPGTGVLTKLLLERKTINSLILVEVDTESVEHLKHNYSDPRLTIIEADFLKLNADQVNPGSFSLIGNFPYNISSQVFFKVIEHRNQIPEVVCMIQKEVAERIVSPPGNKTYGILSVLLQSWYSIEYCFTVSEGVFIPPPKVKSAVIRLWRNEVQELDCDEKLFTKIVKAGFNHRRKTLRNCLKQYLTEDTKGLEVLNLRAEQLSVADFIQLTRVLQEGR